jgi:hypothetical protein
MQEAAKPKELKREEWMLVPPEAGDLISCQFAIELLPSHPMSNAEKGFL